MINKKILFGSLLLFTSFSTLYSQNILKGIVSDADDMPITGANLRWLNSATGGVTDIDGNYEINKFSANNKLFVRYIGYKTYTITVASNVSSFNFILSGAITLN